MLQTYRLLHNIQFAPNYVRILRRVTLVLAEHGPIMRTIHRLVNGKVPGLKVRIGVSYGEFSWDAIATLVSSSRLEVT
jgi:hypothetical protein